MKKNQSNEGETSQKNQETSVNIVSAEYTEMLIRQVKILASRVEMLMKQLSLFYEKHGFRPIYYKLELMKMEKQLKKVDERLVDYREKQK